jgi:hypothetical protein
MSVFPRAARRDVVRLDGGLFQPVLDRIRKSTTPLLFPARCGRSSAYNAVRCMTLTKDLLLWAVVGDPLDIAQLLR